MAFDSCSGGHVTTDIIDITREHFLLSQNEQNFPRPFWWQNFIESGQMLTKLLIRDPLSGSLRQERVKWLLLYLTCYLFFKCGEPPAMPTSSTPLPSGNTVRVRRVPSMKNLTESQASSIGLANYYHRYCELS